MLSVWQLATHPAVVIVPYTKSVMSFFELYRMGIPLFYPSLSLLTKWEVQHRVLTERIYWKFAPSPLRTPPTPNPNEQHETKALAHWLSLCDFFVYPHIQYFDSAEELAEKLSTVDLQRISQERNLRLPLTHPVSYTHLTLPTIHLV